MRSLPIIVDGRRPSQSNLIHSIRILMVALFVIGLHRYAASDHRSDNQPEAIWQQINVAKLAPQASRFETIPGEPFLRRAVALDSHSLAIVALSSPMADHIIGYSGPTSLALIMNENRAVQAVRVLQSFDTPEHLRQVLGNTRFWQQFTGWRLGQKTVPEVDGVSGATLTSLAIAESIATRLSSHDQESTQRHSLKFPKELTNEETQAGALPSTSPTQRVIRTGPLSDAISGYQGPTELLFRVDENNQLLDISLRSSFDNEPYVQYVRHERSFWKRFKGRSLADLATIDLEAEQIDGVSGATMTSLAVATTIREASKAYLDHLATQQTNLTTTRLATQRATRWNFSASEILTILISIAAFFWSGSKLRGNRRLRLLWQIFCFVVVVVVSGNLLSISLISGWTRGGLSYHLAPGLTLLLILAFTMPMMLKRNLYCDHICPHGMLQQWIRPIGKQHDRPLLVTVRRLLSSKKIVGLVSSVAWCSVAVGFLSVVKPLGVNLSWLEPFDAYLLGFGVSLSSVVWVTSVLASRLSPLYYCRNACPTGKILDYVRRDRQRHRLTLTDAVVLAACLWVWFSPL